MFVILPPKSTKQVDTEASASHSLNASPSRDRLFYYHRITLVEMICLKIKHSALIVIFYPSCLNLWFSWFITLRTPRELDASIVCTDPLLTLLFYSDRHFFFWNLRPLAFYSVEGSARKILQRYWKTFVGTRSLDFSELTGLLSNEIE